MKNACIWLAQRWMSARKRTRWELLHFRLSDWLNSDDFYENINVWHCMYQSKSLWKELTHVLLPSFSEWVTTEFAMIVSVDISINVLNILLNILMNIPMNMSKIVDSCFPDWVTGWLNLSLFMMGEYFDERFDKYFDEYSDEYFDKYYIIHPHLLSEDCSDAACKLPVPLGGWWPRKLK